MDNENERWLNEANFNMNNANYLFVITAFLFGAIAVLISNFPDPFDFSTKFGFKSFLLFIVFSFCLIFGVGTLVFGLIRYFVARYYFKKYRIEKNSKEKLDESNCEMAILSMVGTSVFKLASVVLFTGLLCSITSILVSLFVAGYPVTFSLEIVLSTTCGYFVLTIILYAKGHAWTEVVDIFDMEEERGFNRSTFDLIILAARYSLIPYLDSKPKSNQYSYSIPMPPQKW